MAEEDKPNGLRLVKEGRVVPLVTVAGVSEKTLEKVLERLQKNDSLFDYNVPEERRDPGKEGLQEFLVRTYLQHNFEITGEEAVKKYLRLYDSVEHLDNGPSFEYNYYLKPGMKGIIKRVELESEHPLTVLWEPCDEHPKEKELEHDGNGLSLLPKSILARQKISSRIELLAEAAPGRLVEPTSVRFKYSYYLPVGTKGIVAGIEQSAKFPVCVVFGNTEGYIPPSDGMLGCKYSGLKLFRENKIDIRKLIREFS